MTNTLERAKTLLHDKKLSIVLIKDSDIYTSVKRGISPILDIIDENRELMLGADIADKVIGKAAAMLMAANGVKNVYTDVISKHALDVFNKNGISCEYGRSVPYIVNRKGDGMCPMEQTVLNLTDIKYAETLLRNKLKELQG